MAKQNPVLTYNPLGEEIEHRLQTTLHLFGRAMATPARLREIQEEADQITRDVLGATPEDAPMAIVVWSQLTQSVTVGFHPFALAMMTERLG